MTESKRFVPGPEALVGRKKLGERRGEGFETRVGKG